MHIKCGMSKSEWERVKALRVPPPRMFHKSCDAYMTAHPVWEGVKIPYVSKGRTYNVGRNKAKREEGRR